MRERPVFETLLAGVRVEAGRFARVELRAPWGARVGPRDVVALHHVLDGELWLDAGDHHAHVRAGDLVVVPPGTGHALRHRPGAAVTAVHDAPSVDALSVRRVFGGDGPRTVVLCAELTLRGATRSALLRALPTVVHLREPHLDHLLAELRHEIRERRAGASVLAARLVELVLLRGIRAELERPAETGTWRAALTDERIGRALDAVHREPGRAWTVAGLAEVAGMGRAAFAVRFRDLVGDTPVAYLTAWRMDVAREHLVDRPEWTIGRVAASVGYGSEYAFSTAFRRVVGVPPGRYRTESV
ncbi:AraC family transcriptional regulator [Saccharothrix violaceirubra]|uniref:AraC-like DNA-binding protein n=1 Tax=Saccharothrix violaceirubra TaxID=413306 RepID=A0A7W7T3T5_9PSEU|nr:AraC family transcriptional regulator [Saccharothrix violaceirubra]MBB4965786.1 AraC-like DNA-binding protein [Saccharothrix violaceirubra]